MAYAKPRDVLETRITGDYLVSQINGYRNSKTHTEHKKAIQDFDALMDGDFTKLFPKETALSDIPLVENKAKNAIADIKRLAKEARGTTKFMRDGDTEASKERQHLREAIARTIWKKGRGDRLESKLYLDLMATGYCALYTFYNEKSEYPQFLRLDPRFCYPDVQNGQLQNLLYVETMFERQAANKWPGLGLSADPKSTNKVYVTMYFDDYEVCQSVSRVDRASSRATDIEFVDHWVHDLGCVPVAFEEMDWADGQWRGLFDQLGGPIMVRNKVVRLLVDYLESMAHSPFEEKGVINNLDEPGPTRVYHHDPTADFETFMRRVPPAAPAGSVFGLLQYMDAQEQAEAIQPPARVGVVSQSIASGSFVASTQGSLSSLVKEIQDILASLRENAQCTAFAIDEKYLDNTKPLFTSVGSKHTYNPGKDIKGFHHHTVQYGAGAGLNRAEADQRIVMHLTSQLISRDTAQQQIDYLEDQFTEQEKIDREQLLDVIKQRFEGDPATPLSVQVRAAVMMYEDGKSFVQALKEVQPDLFAAEQAAAGAEPGGLGEPGPEAEGMTPQDQALALEKGAGPSSSAFEPEFAPPPLQQVITHNPRL